MNVYRLLLVKKNEACSYRLISHNDYFNSVIAYVGNWMLTLRQKNLIIFLDLYIAYSCERIFFQKLMYEILFCIISSIVNNIS